MNDPTILSHEEFLRFNKNARSRGWIYTAKETKEGQYRIQEVRTRNLERVKIEEWLPLRGGNP